MTSSASSIAWYEKAFREEYLDLYLHRDLREAAQAVALLVARMAIRPGHRVLDLCCGPGRHLAFLGRHVKGAVGLDLSDVLLARARQHWQATCGGPVGGVPLLVRANMRRIPLASASMDRVLNLFTSFGYFNDEVENRAVVGEIARVLRPGGWMAIDHINREPMLAGLRPRSQRTLEDGRMVVEKRSWEPVASRVVKQIECTWPDGRVKHWHESVRVYTLEEMEAMLRGAGLRVEARLGDYEGRGWNATSPRMLLLASKPA